jgi:hypothetical protein
MFGILYLDVMAVLTASMASVGRRRRRRIVRRDRIAHIIAEFRAASMTMMATASSASRRPFARSATTHRTSLTPPPPPKRRRSRRRERLIDSGGYRRRCVIVSKQRRERNKSKICIVVHRLELQLKKKSTRTTSYNLYLSPASSTSDRMRSCSFNPSTFDDDDGSPAPPSTDVSLFDGRPNGPMFSLVVATTGATTGGGKIGRDRCAGSRCTTTAVFFGISLLSGSYSKANEPRRTERRKKIQSTFFWSRQSASKELSFFCFETTNKINKAL